MKNCIEKATRVVHPNKFMPTKGQCCAKRVFGRIALPLIFGCFVMQPFAASLPTGHVTYTLGIMNSDTQEGKDAYARIKIAMDSAMYYYNTYTTITKKITVQYKPSVPTAEANVDGLISFGSGKTYQVTLTAMHETAHTVGIGTTTKWANLTDANQKYTGSYGTKKLKEIDGANAVLKGDDMHFWPYGLNYASEVKSNQDLINHCKIVNEIYKDLYPEKIPPITSVVLIGPSSAAVSVDATGLCFTVWLPSSGCIEAVLFSLSGRQVAAFAKTFGVAGTYPVRFEQSMLPAGQYVYRLIAGNVRHDGTVRVAR